MNRVFLLTGSNLGDSVTYLNKAAGIIGNELGRIVQKSHIYQSESWGYKSSTLFYNQCIEVDSFLSPLKFLEKIIEIEEKMGRTRIGNGYTDREIDIDILFYGEEISEDVKLIMPHPRMHLRKFALVPMCEIAGNFLHPVLKKTISELLNRCEDDSLVTIIY